MTKKVLSTLIALIFVFSLVPAVPTVANTTDIGFQYHIHEPGVAVTITGYTGPGGAIVIPAHIGLLPVTRIGGRAFQGKGLTSVVIPSTVTHIEGEPGGWGGTDGAFLFNNNLSSVTLGSGLIEIGYSAFRDLPNLKSITIPNSVEIIGRYAFQGSGLETVTFGTSLKTIDFGAFNNCKELEEVIIPDSVTSIDNFAFAGCENLRTVVIGNGVTTIGDEAFASMISSLRNLTIGNSVESIGRHAFAHNNRLTSVTLPASLRSVGTGVFQLCQALTSVNIPPGLTTISEQMFSGCSSLVSIEIPDTVTSIGDHAFGGCIQLASINIPGSVKTIGEGAFQSCNALSSVTINHGVESIGNGAFWGLKMPEITLPNSITHIGGGAFGMSSLKTVTIPASVTTIGDLAFDTCKDLTEILVDPENANYSDLDGVLANKAGTRILQYPLAHKSSKIIYDYVDSNGVSRNNNRGYYEVPEGVVRISDGAFRWHNLGIIVFPESLERIGAEAFADSWELRTLVFKTEIPPTIEQYAFDIPLDREGGNLRRLGENLQVWVPTEAAKTLYEQVTVLRRLSAGGQAGVVDVYVGSGPSAPEPCVVCDKLPCECAKVVVCEVCEKETCECVVDETCKACGEDPCVCVAISNVIGDATATITPNMMITVGGNTFPLDDPNKLTLSVNKVAEPENTEKFFAALKEFLQ
jgi:hypothetical protein